MRTAARGGGVMGGAGFSTQDSFLVVYVGCTGTSVIFFNKSKLDWSLLEEASDFEVPGPKSKGSISAPD